MAVACLPAPVVTSLARIGLAALPGTVLGRLADWDQLHPDEQEATAADVRRLAGLLERTA